MNTKLKPEKQFLIDLALDQFKSQFGIDLNRERCDIRSIRPSYQSTHGYEVDTMREDDHVRIRLYFNLGQIDQFKPLRLEVDESIHKETLGDEIYAMVGTVNRFYVDAGIYRFRWLGIPLESRRMIHFMDGSVFEWLDGGIAEYVQAEA